MRKLALALGVGAVIGVAAFLFASRPVTVTEPQRAPEAQAVKTTEGFETPAALTEPGLVITVESDGVPVPEARVELAREFRKRWVTLRAEKTNAAGVVELAAVTGSYVAVARTDDGRSAVHFFDVARASRPTRVTLILKAPVMLPGTVVNAETKEPIGGALVQARPSTSELSAGQTKADSLGRFSIAAPPAKEWTLTATAPGFLQGSAKSDGSAATIKLRRGVKLEGTVVDEKGVAMIGATVRISPSDVRVLETDEAGHFTATIPRQGVSIHASTANGLQALTRIIAKNDIERVTLVVRDGTPLRGTVRDARGPAADVEVRVLAEPEDLEVASLRSKADGAFEAVQLPPGRYSVEAIRGAGSHVRVIGIEVPHDEPVLLELPDAARLQGLVDIDGEPAEGALVTIEWARGMNEPKRAARTGADGRYVFDDLPSAAIEVSASLGNLNAAKPDVYLPPASDMELNLSLSNEGRFVGRVISEPQSDSIGVRAKNADRITRYPLVDGGFDFMLAVGEYKVFVDVEGQLVENTTIEIQGGQDNEAILYSDPPWKHPNFMHQELGSGLSFDNSAGSVRVDFLMEDCPAAKAGVRMGDLVISIDGKPVRDSIEAFARVNKPVGETMTLVVRRNGADLPLTLH